MAILMVMLSMMLPGRVNRVTNPVVAALYIPDPMCTAVGESWTSYHGRAIGLELLVLAFILRSARTWPATYLHRVGALIEAPAFRQTLTG